MLKNILLAVLALSAASAQATDLKAPVVLELFTSQSCSSCPPADALLKQLASRDRDLLPLSFHIDYWDRLGWKDTYSTHEYTERQVGYEGLSGQDNVFTPQLVVNGAKSLNGSDANNIKYVIAEAKQSPPPVEVSAVKKDSQLIISIKPKLSAASKAADILAITFDRHSQTNISGGENSGRELESINNVTSVKSLGIWQPGENKTISLDFTSNDSIAVIVQTQGQGAIIGATSYIK